MAVAQTKPAMLMMLQNISTIIAKQNMNMTKGKGVATMWEAKLLATPALAFVLVLALAAEEAAASRTALLEGLIKSSTEVVVSIIGEFSGGISL